MTWRHGLPACESGERVEVWSRIGPNEWYRFIGVTSMHEGEVIIGLNDMETQDFHSAPPCPTESNQVWRVLYETEGSDDV